MKNVEKKERKGREKEVDRKGGGRGGKGRD
jgi:hypothetical protein